MRLRKIETSIVATPNHVLSLTFVLVAVCISFKSRACARELFRATLYNIPMMALLEPEPSKGGLSSKEVVELLTRTTFAAYVCACAACSMHSIAPL